MKSASGIWRRVPALSFIAAISQALIILTPSALTASPEVGSDDMYWSDVFVQPGVNGTVNAMVSDSSGHLYVGGSFSLAGTMPAASIGIFDGTSWSAMGAGIQGTVQALTFLGPDLYAAGSFTGAGGVAANNIAKWDGNAWSAVDTGLNGTVRTLCVSGGVLYAGGEFTTAGGLDARHIAKYENGAWSGLGSASSNGTNGTVLAIAVDGSLVYAGGQFTQAGGAGANYIAQFDRTDSTWSPLSSGTDGQVTALVMMGGNLCAGGEFWFAGNEYCEFGAVWNGTAWSSLNCPDMPKVMTVIGSQLYIAGGADPYTAVGGWIWDGTQWTWFGNNLASADIHAFAMLGTDLYIGGTFYPYLAQGGRGIGRVEVPNVLPVGNCFNLDNTVRAIAPSDNDVYVGGDFVRAGSQLVNRVAKWNGSSWSALGSGVNGTVRALAANGGVVYAAGEFTAAGGIPANRIAKWDGTWTPLGSGLNGTVHALAVDGDDIYAGGDFTTAGGVSANRIALWHNGAWSSLGSGCNNTVRAIALNGANLWAGGTFTSAGDISASKIAVWNGITWSTPIGQAEFYTHSINAIASMGAGFYAVGSFQNKGSLYSAARWDGSSWYTFAANVGMVQLSSAVVSGPDLWVGGNFSQLDTLYYANLVARWDGSSWAIPGRGIPFGSFDNVYAVAVSGNTLFFGGEFMRNGVDKKDTPYFAMWQPRVDVTTASLSANPGSKVIGDDPHGFFRPALTCHAETTVAYAGGLPTSVTLDRAGEILVQGHRVNGAFKLGPEGMQFGGSGATLRIEFSEDDVVAFGGSYTDFRAVRFAYPAEYPTTKEAAGKIMLPGQGAPTPIRVVNGKQIYAITVPISEISSTYGAIPQSFVPVRLSALSLD